MNDSSFLENAAREMLGQWGLGKMPSPQVIADLVANGAAYWEQVLPDASRLALIRFFSPVVRREEVFLGNVLLNDFLSKALIRAVEQKCLGRIALLANDLENYYYLYHGRETLEAIAEGFRQEVLASLPDLYFGDEDPGRGIYGDMARMLIFKLANREPFPVFTVPKALLTTLLRRVNSHVRSLDADSLDVQRTIATLSFFYARGTRNVDKFDKKKGSYVQRSVSEMQSDFAFLLGAAKDGLLSYDKLREVFVIAEGEDLNEQLYRDRKKSGTIDRKKFKALIETFLRNTEDKIASEGVDTVLASLAGKTLDIKPPELVERLLWGIQLGSLGSNRVGAEGLPCRFCGSSDPVVREKTIIAGTGMTKFFNPAAKQPHPKNPGRKSLCMRCGISSYLETKLLGVMFSADMPVPRQYNIVFHYGHHDEAGVQELAAKIDGIFRVMDNYRTRAREEKRPFSVEYVQEQLARESEERRAQQELEVKQTLDEKEFLAALIADDAVQPGLEALGQMSTDVEAQALPLGVGHYRLIAFILPQLQPGRDEALDFVQRRFSRSRLAAFTLLALLRKLCGCDGPYYFQSVPTLAPGGFDANTFYVQGRAEDADKAIRHYSAIVNFARRVVKWREGHSLLTDWILLAERLEQDPLGMFSEILRDSPLRSGDDIRVAPYRRLSNDFIKWLRVFDGIEYLKLMDQLRQL